MTKAIEDLQSKLTTFDLNLPERIDEGEKLRIIRGGGKGRCPGRLGDHWDTSGANQTLKQAEALQKRVDEALVALLDTTDTSGNTGRNAPTTINCIDSELDKDAMLPRTQAQSANAQLALERKGIESLADLNDYFATTESDGELMADVCDMFQTNVRDMHGVLSESAVYSRIKATVLIEEQEDLPRRPLPLPPSSPLLRRSVTDRLRDGEALPALSGILTAAAVPITVHLRVEERSVFKDRSRVPGYQEPKCILPAVIRKIIGVSGVRVIPVLEAALYTYLAIEREKQRVSADEPTQPADLFQLWRSRTFCTTMPNIIKSTERIRYVAVRRS
ncbi:unnamed protein product [Heligmosomoides polygyrus]|uniref:Uncharacterized protein n=1 Tax=Heligmosomoides polygyrus TaxID=6339 RepID=A0A183GIY6_HELPZ|nr:unnamed protein product [Heligmosomoides polygyrus]